MTETVDAQEAEFSSTSSLTAAHVGRRHGYHQDGYWASALERRPEAAKER